jgi:RHS repeat-associated protein
VESPEIYWFHNAANGMPELLTDGEGQKAWEGINSPWGKLLRESSQRMPVVQQNLRMQGQYLDRETGLHYNLFRYYDPDSGRFTQQDPIGLAGGINLYQYAPNALGWVDPWGLSKCKNEWNDFQKKSNKKQFTSRKQASKAYALWKKQDWAALEQFMGEGAWPPNRGFVTSVKETLQPGEYVDRYGGWIEDGVFRDPGTFLSPAGASFEGRALPDYTLTKPLSTYEVLKPYEVDSGPAIPWFGKPGMNKQYETADYIEDLIKDGVLRKL